MRHAVMAAALACVALLAVAVPAAHAQDAALEQVVARFYPESLEPLSAQDRHACHVALDTANGPVVVAGYTDRSDGALRVLRPDAAGEYAVVFEHPATWDLEGTDCVARLEDVDLDGAPEVFVYFFQTRSANGWVFRWTGQTLENLTPTEAGDDGLEATRMLGPTVYDLTHEGGLRVVASVDLPVTAPGVRPRNPAFIYRLGSEGLEVDGSALGVYGFLASVSPEANQRFFRLIFDSVPPVTLRVINGERDGANRVTAATITVNNEVVLGPGDVHAGVELVEVALDDVFTTNELHVALEGPPDARVIVLIQDATPRTGN